MTGPPMLIRRAENKSPTVIFLTNIICPTKTETYPIKNQTIKTLTVIISSFPFFDEACE